MRKHTLVNSLKCALLGAPFLVACGGGLNTSPVVLPAGGLVFPDCADGELISVGADKTLGCAPAPTGKLTPQNCLTGQVLTSENGTFKCVAVGNGTTDATIVARIMNAQSQLNQINNTVNNLKAGGGGRAKYLGITGNTKGRITSGNKVGVSAAAELCAGAFNGSPTAHMCTVYEAYEAVATGQIKDTDTIGKAWVYMVGWNNPGGSAPTPSNQEGDAGMSDNCGSYTYPTGDVRWTGTAFAWQIIPYHGAANTRGLKFFGGSAQAACNQSYPIACCE
jgi:hypothetical protein